MIDYLHPPTPPVTHRDIKPQYLILTPRGKIRLLDFGIAKGVDTQLDTISNKTFIAATLHYSPIEQILRVLDISVRTIIAYQHNEKIAKIEKQNADPGSDIYALGATLYHLLTNQLPIDALKRAMEVWNRKPDPLINPQQINPNIRPEISEWLLKAMSVDSEDRFISASEMRQTLHQNFAETKIYGIKDRKQESNHTNGIYAGQETLKLNAEILFNPQQKASEREENFSARKETEDVTSLLPFPTQPSVIDDTFESSQKFPTEQNLIPEKISGSAKEIISDESAPLRNTFLSSKKGRRLFLILPLIALFLFIVGGYSD